MNSLRAFIFLASSFCIHCGQAGAAEGLSLLSLDKKQGWEAYAGRSFALALETAGNVRCEWRRRANPASPQIQFPRSPHPKTSFGPDSKKPWLFLSGNKNHEPLF